MTSLHRLARVTWTEVTHSPLIQARLRVASEVAPTIKSAWRDIAPRLAFLESTRKEINIQREDAFGIYFGAGGNVLDYTLATGLDGVFYDNHLFLREDNPRKTKSPVQHRYISPKTLHHLQSRPPCSYIDASCLDEWGETGTYLFLQAKLLDANDIRVFSGNNPKISTTPLYLVALTLQSRTFHFLLINKILFAEDLPKWLSHQQLRVLMVTGCGDADGERLQKCDIIIQRAMRKMKPGTGVLTDKPIRLEGFNNTWKESNVNIPQNAGFEFKYNHRGALLYTRS
ncbi:MAG: hypothetical protein WC890_06905 [Candidatus Margulisiibacteriota bacterium]